MKKIIDIIVSYTYRLILIFSILCFSVALIGAIFFCVNRSYHYLNPILLIIGSLSYLFLIFKGYRFIIKLSEKHKSIICGILLVMQFILLWISTRVISSIPQVDLIHILTGINSLNHTGSLINNDYFSVYPNNRFLLMILYGITKLSQENSELLFGLLGSCCITVMSFFTYQTVKEVSNSSKALLSLLFLVCSPIFYLYVSYCYTDILMLPFASILIYLIAKHNKEKDTRKNILRGILIGFVSVISYKIRAVAIFLLIAYFVYLIFQKRGKDLIRHSLPIIISIVFTFCWIQKIENKIFVNIDQSKQFPMTHWIMMGVNLEHYGYYSQDDYYFSASALNIEERQKRNIEEIKNRIQRQGLIGNTKLAFMKLVTVWGKGDYSYQKYLELVKDYNHSYRYVLEDRNIVINYMLQISNIVILLLCLLSFHHIYQKKEKSIIAIALFGAIVFYLIWEVCPRYGLSFLPWMILFSTYSYDIFSSKYQPLKDHKSIKYGVLFITIILLGTGFFEYTHSDQRSTLIAKDTVKKVKYVELNKNTSITQSVKLYDSFNEIKLKFRWLEENNTVYQLALFNERKEMIYQKEFLKKDLQNEKYTTFRLDRTYPKGTYIVRLQTAFNSDLEVYIAYKQEFDYYPKGILKINDKEEPGDLMFEIKRIEERPIFSYMEYIIIIALILGTQYIIFFKKEGINR